MRGKEPPAVPSVARRLYGREEGPPSHRLLSAGALSATLEGGALRWIEYDGLEILRGIYGAVRDPGWNTIEPVLSEVTVTNEEGLAVVEFIADHRATGIDFRWRSRIRLEAAGTVTFELDGEALAPCDVARVGLCVLHPDGLAGVVLEAETAAGSILSRFPDAIEPSRWLTDLVALRWPAGPGVRASLSLVGDLFEIEDQRNWTDGSYKTFSRPLRLPWPYRLVAGERLRQVVRLELTGRSRRRRPRSDRPPSPPGVATVAVGRLENPMTALGTGWPRDGSSLSGPELAILRELAPAHLRVVLDLESAAWPDRLARSRADARSLGARLELEAIEGRRDGWRQLAGELGSDRTDIARVLVFARTTYDTPGATLAAACAALASEAGTPIGGGSRENFAELNRLPTLPDGLEIIAFPVCPQVHASDEATILETIAVQRSLAVRAGQLSRGRPIVVGPVTLRPLMRATGESADREGAVDSRQASLFAAGWLVGSIEALAAGGATAATYFDAVGRAGFLDRSDPDAGVWLWPTAIFPSFHVFRALATAERRHQIRIDGLSVRACAVRTGRRLTVVVANTSAEAHTVTVSVPRLDRAQVSIADENSFAALVRDPRWLDTAGSPTAGPVDRLELRLPRLAIAFVRGWLAPSIH